MSDQICLVKNRYRCNYLITITLFNYFYFVMPHVSWVLWLLEVEVPMVFEGTLKSKLFCISMVCFWYG